MFSLKDWTGKKDWKNWVGYEQATPEQKLVPNSIDELQEIVRNAVKNGKRVRVTGAGHSFSPVAKPEEVAITLHNMRGIIAVNHDAQEVTLAGGTYLHEIGPALLEHGYALENMGDVQNQTIAGAVSTATHGTGITLGSVANPVMAWQWIDGNGELHEHRRADDDLSKSLHLSLGMLGIMVAFTVKVVPIYGLHESSEAMSFEDGIAQFMDTTNSVRHMEWFLFPGTNKLQQKVLKVCDPHPMSKKQHLMDKFEGRVVLNGAFYALSEIARRKHSFVKTVSKISAAGIPNTVRSGYSYEVFPKPRGVLFNESEYFVSLDKYKEALTHFNDALMHDTKLSHFPIEVRTHKGETGFLSPTQGKDSLVMSFHVYKGIPSDPLFDWLKEEMKAWEGRPHWGKVNKLSHTELRELYPDMDKFLAVREKYDPNRVFMNKFLQERFLGE